MARHKHTITPERDVVLKAICTVKQASFAWGRSVDTIRYHICENHIAAIRLGRDVIISIPSAVAYFGMPINPL